MFIAAERVSAELVQPSIGMAKTEAKSVSAAAGIDPRPVQVFGSGDRGRKTSEEYLRGCRKADNPHTCLEVAQIAKRGGVEREPT